MGTAKFCRTFYCFLQETRDQVPKYLVSNDSKACNRQSTRLQIRFRSQDWGVCRTSQSYMELRAHAGGKQRQTWLPDRGTLNIADRVVCVALEALLQRDIPSPALDVGCRLVVAVFGSASHDAQLEHDRESREDSPAGRVSTKYGME